MPQVEETETNYIARLQGAVSSLNEIPLVTRVTLHPEEGQIRELNDAFVRVSLDGQFVEAKTVTIRGGKTKTLTAAARRRPTVHCSRERPTHLNALLAMKELLLREYAEEMAAAAAVAITAASPPEESMLQADERPHPNAFDVMAAGRNAHSALKRVLKEAERELAAAQAAEAAAARSRKAAEGELAKAKANLAAMEPRSAAQREYDAKRQRTAQSSSQERPPHYDKYASYDLSHWLSTTGEIMNRRAVEPVAGVKSPAPVDGDAGALHHWRRGLAGCVRDWAAGSLDNVTTLIIGLISHFKVTSCLLPCSQLRTGHVLSG